MKLVLEVISLKSETAAHLLSNHDCIEEAGASHNRTWHQVGPDQGALHMQVGQLIHLQPIIIHSFMRTSNQDEVPARNG